MGSWISRPPPECRQLLSAQFLNGADGKQIKQVLLGSEQTNMGQ
jgi:hypothetical protein